MRTNYQMIKEFKNEFNPQSAGTLEGLWVQKIKETFELDNRDELSLRNLRDFAVLYFTSNIEEKEFAEQMRLTDMMSALTYVIDMTLFDLGAEV